MIISIAQQASPKPSGNSAFLRAQFWAVSNLREQQPLLDLALEVLSLELAAQHLLGLQLPHPELLALDLGARHFHSRAPLRQTNTNATSSSTTKTIVSTRANTPKASSFNADRIEEDHLDVEQDEEHRDQVEADPEAERLLHVGRQAALVRLALHTGRALRPEQVVGNREGGTDADPKKQEDERW